MSTITYGTSRKDFDHLICQTQKKFTLEFSGHGIIDDNPPTSIYLRRSGGAHAFYIPEGAFIQMSWKGVVYDLMRDTFDEVVETGGKLTRTLGGNITYTGGEIESAPFLSITPWANTAVQGLQVVVAADAAADFSIVVVSLTAECLVFNGETFQQVFQGAATAPLTTAE